MSANPSALSDAQVRQALQDLPDWSGVSGEIQRTFQFRDFAQAMSFVNKVAQAAESAHHHPDVLIRYNKVTLTLTTHDAGGLTARDFDLARACDALARPAAG